MESHPLIPEREESLPTREEAPWTSLVPIQRGGPRIPLFCFHAGRGIVDFYFDLARELGPEQPVYALQARGLHGGAPPDADVEEMVEHYIREVRTVQPEGPYCLTGFCFGGVLAFAMARRLREEGSGIALLSCFDGGLREADYAFRMEPDGTSGRRVQTRTLGWVSRHLSKLRRLSARDRIGYLKDKARTRLLIWTYPDRSALRLCFGDAFRRLGRPLPKFLRSRYVSANSYRAMRRYAPSPYPGRMVLFVTRDLFEDSHLGWDRYVEELEIHEISAPRRAGETLEDRRIEFIRAVAAPLGELLNAAAGHAAPFRIRRASDRPA